MTDGVGLVDFHPRTDPCIRSEVGIHPVGEAPMHISKIEIINYRNFKQLSVAGLPPTAVVVGENNVGKSNLLDALRLVLDPSLPDNARILRSEDFWDGLGSRFGGSEIQVVVEV